MNVVKKIEGVFLLFVLICGACAESEALSIADFTGKRIGVFTGSIHDKIIQEVLSDAKLFYFDGLANAAGALSSRKIDAIAKGTEKSGIENLCEQNAIDDKRDVVAHEHG